MITLKDMFCGCGGSSQGARKVAGVQVKYAMNHWKLAVESHNTNHPDTHHDCADISETHPARYDRTTGLIASPECTNHSLAKGLKRKNLAQQEIFQQKAFDLSEVRSRATMWDVVRFTEQHKYEFVVVENVVDVRYWILFDSWLKAMHSMGYKHKCVYLNAQFAHGPEITGFAPQSRDRIYIVFWKKGNPAPDLDIRPKAPCIRCGEVEAIQSWKPNRNAGKYKQQYVYRCSCCGEVVNPYYYAAINAIDFSIPMIKIGDREKLGMRKLSPNTMARIQYGREKFGDTPTMLDQRNQSGKVSTRIRSVVEDVWNTQSTGYSSYLFAPFIFNMSFTSSKGDRTYGMNGLFPTQTTQESMAFVSPFVIADRKNAKPIGFNGQLPTITTRRNDLNLFIPPIPEAIKAYLAEAKPMVTAYYTKPQANRLTDTISTVKTKDTHALIETFGNPSIEECYFRMLQPSETSRAQGFPDDYVILGNKEDQQKQIGNANPPPTMELLVARCAASLQSQTWY